MIAKVLTNSSINLLMNYLCNQAHSVIDTKGILPFDLINNVTRTFKRTQLFNDRIKKPNFHIVLAFSPEDNLDEEKMNNVVNDFLDEFDGANESWVAIKHKDSSDGHQHLHIALNRVLLNGCTLDDSYSAKRAMEIARRLEVKYDLKQISGKKEENINQLYDILRTQIDKGLLVSKSIKDLVNYIESQTDFKMVLGRGVSFIDKSNGVCIKGSSLGRDYSRQNLEMHIGNNNSEGKAILPSGDTLIGGTIKQEYNLYIDLFSSNNQPTFQETDEEEEKKKKKKRKFKRR